MGALGSAMFNPLEDERVQLGVIGLASVAIVSFLTSLAWEAPPEKGPALARAPVDVVDVGAAVVARDEVPSVPSVTAEAPPAEAPREVVEAAGIRTSFPLESATPSRVESATPSREVGEVSAEVPKPRPVVHSPARIEEKGPQKRKPVRHMTALRPQSWLGPLPNKKGDPEE
jgi:hypothetical protein